LTAHSGLGGSDIVAVSARFSGWHCRLQLRLCGICMGIIREEVDSYLGNIDKSVEYLLAC
jgi:hypothetical protein